MLLLQYTSFKCGWKKLESFWFDPFNVKSFLWSFWEIFSLWVTKFSDDVFPGEGLFFIHFDGWRWTLSVWKYVLRLRTFYSIIWLLFSSLIFIFSLRISLNLINDVCIGHTFFCLFLSYFILLHFCSAYGIFYELYPFGSSFLALSYLAGTVQKLFSILLMFSFSRKTVLVSCRLNNMG